jgi:hypothetical protein
MKKSILDQFAADAINAPVAVTGVLIFVVARQRMARWRAEIRTISGLPVHKDHRFIARIA